jgi:hypothetical protein
VATIGSNLACIGLDVPDLPAFEALLRDVLPLAVTVGTAGNVEVRRWEDPSGARLAITLRGRSVEGVLPSFAGAPGADLGAVAVMQEDVCEADVLLDGEVATRCAVALEEAYLLGRRTASGRASIVALAREIESFADEAAFTASPASLLSPDADPESPPPDTLPDGVRWPIRVAPESFMSMGLFATAVGGSGGATPEARLAATVIASERRRCERTGQAFDVLRVRTVGLEADLCMPAGDGDRPPGPGAVVAGYANIMGSLPSILDLPPEPARPRFRMPWRRSS